MSKGIVTEYEKVCFFCERPAECEHHLVFGKGKRDLAEEDGLKVPIRRMQGLFPYLFSEETINQEDQLLETFEILRNARKIKKEIRVNANNINYKFKRWSK